MIDAVLTLGSEKWLGWTKLSVTRSLDTVAGVFDLSLTDRWPGQNIPKPIKGGEACLLTLDGDTVITGYVDDPRPSYGPKKREISVSGRDRTGDLVDCSAVHKPGEWHNRSLEYIAAALLKPFDILVRCEVKTEPFKRFRIEEGETVFDSIERMCRMRAVLPTSNILGELLITTSGKGGYASVRLEAGQNILKANGNFSVKDRYSEYTVKGQQPLAAPSDASHITATVKDSEVKRYRPLVIIAEDATDQVAAKKRAEWEKNVRRARSKAIRITVHGWRERPSGPLWMPNRLVPVTDADLGLNNVLMLTTSVTFNLSGEGRTTALTLMPPNAYNLLAEEPKGGSKWI